MARVGDARSITRRRGDRPLIDLALGDDATRNAYAGAGQQWADDAMLAYGPLAEHLVDRCPAALRDHVVLDAGAGTGAVGMWLAAAGARAVACDLEVDMLGQNTIARAARSSAVADVRDLPFRRGTFDAAFAGFVLNHLANPVAALRELGRVTRCDGFVLASVFADDRAPAKDAVDAVLAANGWQPPVWYRALNDRAAALATQERMQRAALRAGFVDARVERTDVDVGLDDPALVVRCRFGMPQVSEFLAGLAPNERATLVCEATRAVERTGAPFRPTVVELVARVS